MNIASADRIRFLIGPLVTAAVVGAMEAARIAGVPIPNPQLFTAVAITFAAFLGGYRGGLLAAVIGVGYAFYFFATPGGFFDYTDTNFSKVVVNLITLPAISVLVSELNKKYKNSIDNEMSAFLFNANAPVFFIGADGKISLWNKYLQQLTGYTSDDVVGCTIHDHHVFSRDPVSVASGLTAEPESRATKILDMQLTCKAGTPVDLLVSVLLQRDGFGDPTGTVCIGQDVTGRKRAENQLRESKQRYQRLVDLSPDGVMVDCDGEVVFCNQALATLLGADSPDAIIGCPAMDFIPQEDRATVMERRRAGRNGQQIGFRESDYLRLDGSRVEVERTNVKIDWEGADAVLVLARDITDRRKAERQFKQIVDSLEDGFALYDEHDCLVMWNDRWFEIYGGVSDIIRVGMPFEVFLRTNIERGVFLDAIGCEEDFIRDRLRHRRQPADRSIRSLSGDRWVFVREARTEDGGTFTIHTDVTEIKKAESEAQAARALAEEADRAKSEFLANMSHELRTPLNAIIGFSGAIDDQRFGPIENEKYRTYIQDINRSGEHLLALIDDILDLSRVEFGAVDLHEKVVDVAEAAASVMRLVEERAARGAVELSLQMAEGLPNLKADARMLNQMLLNLLTNGIKFTEAGGQVALRIGCSAESGYLFEVIDNGRGIAPEDIPRALSKFGQVDSSLTRQHEGTGLGLPLTKSLVELHGGSLEITSKLDSGTTASLRFPAARIVAPDTEARRRSG